MRKLFALVALLAFSALLITPATAQSVVTLLPGESLVGEQGGAVYNTGTSGSVQVTYTGNLTVGDGEGEMTTDGTVSLATIGESQVGTQIGASSVDVSNHGKDSRIFAFSEENESIEILSDIDVYIYVNGFGVTLIHLTGPNNKGTKIVAGDGSSGAVTWTQSPPGEFTVHEGARGWEITGV